MQDLLWDNTPGVQVQEIDDDHRKLVNLFNLLNHAVKEEEPKALLEALLEELISCTDCHFRHEERLMLKCRYEGFEIHRREHQKLIDSINALQESRRKQGKPVVADDHRVPRTLARRPYSRPRHGPWRLSQRSDEPANAPPTRLPPDTGNRPVSSPWQLIVRPVERQPII
jgi:hemerythrin-like metal-binding protein